MRKAIIRISGVVQGVGFRPFLVRLAQECRVTGFVKNECGHVFVEAYAYEHALLRFIDAIPKNAPAASCILRLEHEIRSVSDAEESPAEFHIHHSESCCGGIVTPSPDIATCDDCLMDLFSPSNPRYRNPFISCTNCGPRYSILHAIPYDRANTSMDTYPMCPLCDEEYRTSSNRRFHAQTVCCNDCGPILEYYDRESNARGERALREAIRALRDGKIVAVKGIGGYHFACDPYNDAAVAALRALKGREHKPFAVMFRDIEDIGAHCIIGPEEEALLSSPARPIVLLRRTLDSLSKHVCAKSPYLGVFLPYTPLQHLLLQQTGPLVMTSANVTSHPIMMEDWAIMRFFSEHDGLYGVLTHDRAILRRLDDSVAMVVRGKTHILRRARGYVPLPLPTLGGTELIACGPQEKATVCLHRDGLLYPSGEIGNLDSIEMLRAYRRTVNDMRDTLHISPQLAICDMHPEYESTRYAKSMCIPVMEVQHHHAHVASVMAEHELTGNIIGVAFDGTGYGPDGTVWGGEFLIVSSAGYKRVAHLKPVRLLGSDSSIRQGWKTALCMLYDAGLKVPVKSDRTQLVASALQNGVNTICSSSMGRVFDAVSALLGICEESSYDGQCAIELEYAARRWLINGGQAEPLPFSLAETEDTVLIDFAPCFQRLQVCISQGDNAELLALRFHRTVCRMIADVLAELRDRYGIRDIALSGGVFQNRILLEEVIPLLEELGFTVYTNRQVPTGDGGLSLGQAYIGLMANR